jgi:chemotaxis protein methyltransferase CheR
MNETHFPQLERLIAAHTGLQLRPRERDALRTTLAVRMAALNLHDTDAYRRLLEAGTLDAEHEWEQLTGRLTNNESYFFRDKGQMALLRDRILPELIARNRGRRSLRLWSAGCSTGEEAYSLAMLVEELLPQRGAASGAPWEILILGTDLDAPALQVARQGIYSAWSFRTMESTRQQRWFQHGESGWQVAEECRAMVSFRRCNLAIDSFPSAKLGIDEMDLILCRNVFIYFAPAAVSAVLPKFARTLREGGYLMTGHSETLGQLVEPLAKRHFPESVVYQRVKQATARVRTSEEPAARSSRSVPVHAPAPPHPPATGQTRRQTSTVPAMEPKDTAPSSVGRRAERALSEAETLYGVGDNPGVIRVLQGFVEPAGARALLLLAHAHANLGHAEEAAADCQRLIAAFPFAAEPYELLSALAQEQGRYDDAKLLLKQAVYLASDMPTPCLELSELYDHEGDRVRARKMRSIALELLKRMPAEAMIGFYGGPTAQEWIRHLEQRLTEGD